MSSSSSNSTSTSSSSSGATTSPRPPRKRYLHNYGKYSSIYNTPFALWKEKWWRRTISMTMIATVFLLLTALFPVLCLVALVFDAILYKRNKGLNYVRVLSFFESYLIIEFIAMISSFLMYVGYYFTRIFSSDPDKKRWNRLHYWYQTWWGGKMLFGWSCATLGLRVQVQVETLNAKGEHSGGFTAFMNNETKQKIADTLGVNPKIMFLRHASFADTLVPQGLLSNDYHMRYIVKQELLWDPGLDISGSRTPNFFLYRDAGTDGMDVEMEAIRNLVRDFKVGGQDVTCIWPEGTRFSKSKREKVLESLKRKNDPKYEFADGLKHTLLPKVGGALTLLDSNPCGDVIFCSHIGLEASSNFAQMMKGKLCNRIVKIKFTQVKYSDIPKTKEARIEWLLEHWKKIDNWVDQQLITEKASNSKKNN